LRPYSPLHDDLAIDEVDDVSTRPRVRRLDAHLSRLPAEENLACTVLNGSMNAAKSLHALELIEDPGRVCGEETRHVLTVARVRLDDFDAKRPHSNA